MEDGKDYRINEKMYKEKTYDKMDKLEMNREEYNTFILQGIKKELISIRRMLEEGERKWQK